MPISISADSPHEFLEFCRAVAAGPSKPCVKEPDSEEVAERLEANLLHQMPTDLTDQVQQFFTKFEFTDRLAEGPADLSTMAQQEVKHRLVVVVREFTEVLEEFGIDCTKWRSELSAASGRAYDRRDFVKVDLAKLTHELADLDFAVEGMRVAFGLPRKPVAMCVYASNMAKEKGAGWDPKKPPGWESPYKPIQELLDRERLARSADYKDQGETP